LEAESRSCRYVKHADRRACASSPLKRYQWYTTSWATTLEKQRDNDRLVGGTQSKERLLRLQGVTSWSVCWGWCWEFSAAMSAAAAAMAAQRLLWRQASPLDASFKVVEVAEREASAAIEGLVGETRWWQWPRQRPGDEVTVVATGAESSLANRQNGGDRGSENWALPRYLSARAAS